MIEPLIERVRHRVLQLVSEEPAHLFDNQDIESHIRSRDGLIRIFCTQYVDDRNSHDVEAISERITETLKWRKSFGITTRKPQDFPLEFYTRQIFMIHEDEDYFIGIYDMSFYKKVSQRWDDLIQQFIQYFHNNYCLEAVHAGKQVIMMTDAANAGAENMNNRLQAENMRIVDTHFPCLSNRIGCFGVPWYFAHIGTIFVRFSLPSSMKKRFRMYSKDTIRDFYEPHLLPIPFGGTLPLKRLIDVDTVPGLQTLRQYGEDHGFDEWEIDKMRSILNANIYKS